MKLAIFILTGRNEYPHIKRQGDLHDFMFTQCIKDESIGNESALSKLLAGSLLCVHNAAITCAAARCVSSRGA